MSDKAHKIIATIGTALFAVAAALLTIPSVTAVQNVRTGLEIAMAVLGALGFAVTRPLVSPAKPQGLPLPEGPIPVKREGGQ